MPRRIPRFEAHLQHEIVRAEDLIMQFEAAKVRQKEVPAAERITLRSLDFVYELAYLSVFKTWEQTLEDCFVRFLCGYENGAGVPVFRSPYQRQLSLSDATTLMLGGRQYLLWHNPTAVYDRSRKYFTGHTIEQVISSKLSDLGHYANVRHRIAHGQEDSKMKFDLATMALCGRRYRASSAGNFLRDWVPGALPPRRWVEEISTTLQSLAVQIVS